MGYYFKKNQYLIDDIDHLKYSTSNIILHIEMLTTKKTIENSMQDRTSNPSHTFLHLLTDHILVCLLWY